MFAYRLILIEGYSPNAYAHTRIIWNPVRVWWFPYGFNRVVVGHTRATNTHTHIHSIALRMHAAAFAADTRLWCTNICVWAHTRSADHADQRWPKIRAQRDEPSARVRMRNLFTNSPGVTLCYGCCFVVVVVVWCSRRCLSRLIKQIVADTTVWINGNE